MKAGARTPLLAIVLALALGTIAGIAVPWLMQLDEPADAAGVVGQPRPAFAHAGVDGRLWRASDFDGKPLLVNFWATWCQPCLREMPLLQSLSEERPGQLQIIGIAIDRPDQVGDFVDRLGITYPILIGTSDVRETQSKFGNPEGMLPYTVLIDPDGTIRWRHLGELDRKMLDEALPRVL